jgi:hypothetical protein
MTSASACDWPIQSRTSTNRPEIPQRNVRVIVNDTGETNDYRWRRRWTRDRCWRWRCFVGNEFRICTLDKSTNSECSTNACLVGDLHVDWKTNLEFVSMFDPSFQRVVAVRSPMDKDFDCRIRSASIVAVYSMVHVIVASTNACWTVTRHEHRLVISLNVFCTIP